MALESALPKHVLRQDVTSSRAQVPMASASQEENKFAHLLEPIRDLASNWNVNIADELEDYLVRQRCLCRMVAQRK